MNISETGTLEPRSTLHQGLTENDVCVQLDCENTPSLFPSTALFGVPAACEVEDWVACFPRARFAVNKLKTTFNGHLANKPNSRLLC